jgi:hypothetical protein
MASFTPVAAGNPTNASDINQLINALNATTGSQVSILSSSSSAFAIGGYLPSAGTGTAIMGVGVTGDALFRASMYLATGNYGGFAAGNGASVTAHLYAGASGWSITENLAVGGTLTVSSTSSLAGTSITGTLSVSGAATLGAGSTVGGNTIPGFIGGGLKISVQATAPSSPTVNDVWLDTTTNLG